MGYTHYWYKPSRIETKTFNSIKKDFQKVLPEFKDIICAEYDKPNEAPIINSKEIIFNGKEGNGHETMFFTKIRTLADYEKIKDDGLIFDFCKTARKPYDIAVTCFLIIAKRHLKDSIKVRSDGNLIDWKPAKDLCHSILKYGKTFKI